MNTAGDRNRVGCCTVDCGSVGKGRDDCNSCHGMNDVTVVKDGEGSPTATRSGVGIASYCARASKQDS